MDGNGRWAKQRSLPRTAGHRAGAKVVEKLLECCLNAGVRYVTLFCFSTENWKRPKDEVDTLFSMLNEYLSKEIQPVTNKGVKVSFAGRTDLLPEKTREMMAKVENVVPSPENQKLHLILAISYGGREEIVDAARALAKRVQNGEIRPDEIDEKAFSSALYLPDVPEYFMARFLRTRFSGGFGRIRRPSPSIRQSLIKEFLC